jgi:hypothetical protein
VTRILATLVACARLRRPGRAGHVARTVALVALLAGCEGGSGQGGSAFNFLSIDGFSQTGTNIDSSIESSTNQNTTTIACVTLRNNLKNPTITGPSPLDNVIIQSYTVTLRQQGGGQSGPFTFGTAILVPAGTAAAMTNNVTDNTRTAAIILVPPGAKGGAGTVATADVRFSGHDGRGNSINEEGAVTILFDEAVTDARPNCGTATPPATT